MFGKSSCYHLRILQDLKNGPIFREHLICKMQVYLKNQLGYLPFFNVLSLMKIILGFCTKLRSQLLNLRNSALLQVQNQNFSQHSQVLEKGQVSVVNTRYPCTSNISYLSVAKTVRTLLNVTIDICNIAIKTENSRQNTGTIQHDAMEALERNASS